MNGMNGTETTEDQTALTKALATQLFYLRALFVLGLAIAVMLLALTVAPANTSTVTVVGSASTPATSCAPITCATAGSGGVEHGADMTTGSGGSGGNDGPPDMSSGSGGSGYIADQFTGTGGGVLLNGGSGSGGTPVVR